VRILFDFGQIISDAVEFFLEQVVDGMFSMIAGLMVNISSSAILVLELELVKQAIIYSQVIAISLLTLKIVFEGTHTYILRQSGDPDSDPGGILIRAAQSIAIITAVPWLVRNLYMFGSTVANDVSKLPGVDYKTTANPLKALWDVYSATSGPTITLFAIGIIIGLVMIIVVIVQSFIRAGELAVIAVVGAWMSVSLGGTNNGVFVTWWKELLAISLTQAIQIFLIKVAFSALVPGAFGLTVANNPFTALLLFIGILWVCIKSPSILRSYIHSTGTGKVAGQAGSMVIMKMAMRGGK
jgi:hypothetical protein